ncbi:MAG TPA: ABC transporter substrate-binding protein [bacterium]|nr:ABC transporter substrate-binding protein [bacterium]
MRIPHRFAGRAALCGVAAALLLWGGPQPAPAAAVPARLGYIGISSDAGIFIAIDKGYFKEQSVEVSLERFGLGADQMALLGAGQLDVASGAVSPTMFNAIARGLPIAVVADKGSFRTGFGFNVLVVRKMLVDGGQFKTLADLRGRTLAVPGPGSILNFEDYLVLKKGGLTPNDVRIEYIDLADQPAAMANGRLDAAIMVEPFATASEQRGIGKIVMPLDQLLPEFQTSVIYFNTAWARAHADQAKGWMVAYVKGLRYYNAALRNRRIRDDVITIMAAHTPIKDRAVWDKMIWPGLNPNGTATARTLLDYQRWLLNEHQTSEFLPPARFLDTSYTEYATRILGAWQP